MFNYKMVFKNGHKSLQKGKTFEEIYGIEKSREIKRKIGRESKGKSPWNKGLPKEQQPNYGRHHSEEQRKKMSRIIKNLYDNGLLVPPNLGKQFSKETREKISLAHKGKKLSEEHKRRLSEVIKRWHKEVGFSEETRKKLSKINKERTISETTKRKISEANKGKTSWMKGLTMNDSRVKKLIEKSSKTKRKLYEEGKLKPWNLGKHHSEETRKKISLKRKGRTYEQIMGVEKALQLKKKKSELGRKRLIGKNNPMHGRFGEKNPHFGKPAEHGKYSFRKDLGHHCRSKWEANYSRFLLLKNRKYKYEPKTFIITLLNGIKATYTPDFLVDGIEWHELKGWADRSKINKWELFQKQYPNEKLVLIDHDTYKKLERIYKYIIPNWEN